MASSTPSKAFSVSKCSNLNDLALKPNIGIGKGGKQRNLTMEKKVKTFFIWFSVLVGRTLTSSRKTGPARNGKLYVPTVRLAGKLSPE